METITANWTVDEATLLRGRYWHWFKTPWLPFLIPAMGCLLIAFAARNIHVAQEWDIVPWLWIVLGLAMIFRYWILGLGFRDNIRKIPGYGEPIEYRFTEEGFDQRILGAESKVTWSKLYETVVTREGLLIYPQKNLFLWIPRDAFGDPQDFERVANQLLQHTSCRDRRGNH